MDRVEQSEATRRALFGEAPAPAHLNDPELEAIHDRFVWGQVWHTGPLEETTRALVTLVVLAANQTLPQLRAYTAAALRAGATPVQVKEALYQCAPYIGFAKVQNALEQANDIFRQEGVALPTPPQATTDETTRFAEGLRVQTEIFGDVISQARQAAPAGQQHIQDWLSAFCFGDFYTRGGLPLQTRELLTLCMLCALGGCEAQVKSHLHGNLNVGNPPELLVAAISHCMPYIGFPRTLNALACLNEVLAARR